MNPAEWEKMRSKGEIMGAVQSFQMVEQNSAAYKKQEMKSAT